MLFQIKYANVKWYKRIRMYVLWCCVYKNARCEQSAASWQDKIRLYRNPCSRKNFRFFFLRCTLIFFRLVTAVFTWGQSYCTDRYRQVCTKDRTFHRGCRVHTLNKRIRRDADTVTCTPKLQLWTRMLNSECWLNNRLENWLLLKLVAILKSQYYNGTRAMVQSSAWLQKPK